MFLYQNYDLLKKLSQDEINTILFQCPLYNQCKDDLLKLPYIFPTTNFVAVCNFVDYYILLNDSEFIYSIICEIFIQNPEVVNNMSNIPQNLLQKIYKNENVERWLKEGIKYRIYHAIAFGYLNIVKYLFEVRKMDCSTNVVNNPSPFNLCLTNDIDVASYFDHLDIVRYLFEVAHKDCTKNAIIWASHRGNLRIVKYLIEVQNKKFSKSIKSWANEEVLCYLLTKRNSFIE